MELCLKSHRHRFLRGVLVVVALATLTTTALAITPRAFAQSDVPDAPTAVAVYSIESQKLEVRWSTSDAANTTSFKIQWKSGSEEFDSSRQVTSDPATSIESDQSTSAGHRYVDTITGLTDGTQYTVQVIAANANGDSDPSTTATGTPASEPGQAREFWENEVVKIFEGSFPWLRETWDHITARNAPVDWAEADWEAGFHGQAIVQCNHSTPSKLRECYADAVSLSRSYPNLIYGIAHELAHVYTLANNVTATPGPLGVARLYFHALTAGGSKGGTYCTPVELFADGVVIATLGDRFVSSVSYWSVCSLTTDTVTEQALAVVRSALSGQMPPWFGDTYNDSDSNPDLARVWREVKAMSESHWAAGGFRATVVFQLRDSFGGYCDNQKATDSAFGSGVTRNPWRDGGCVPEAPTNASVTPVGSGKLSVSWQEPPGDGGSPLEGYKVQWKSGTQEYHPSRQVVVTDLTKIVWLQTISGLTNDESHTVRVLAYNHNGDGAAAELTATPTATDTMAPALLLTRFDSRSVRLIWDEALDASSRPQASAFTVNVNGSSRNIYEVAVLANAVWLSVSGTITTTDVLTVSYVVPTGSGATPLKDSAGNNAPRIPTTAVRNDRIQIVITNPGPDKTYSLGRGFGGQDSIEATVTFSEAVVVSELPELNLEVGGQARTASYHSGSGTKSLVFRYEVAEGETETEGIWVRSSGNISKLRGPGKVRYASTKAVVPARLWSSIRTDYLVDAVRPTLVRANALADGNDLTLTWDKALDEDPAPTTTGTQFFEVQDTSDDSSRQITAISVSGKVVTLTLSSVIATTDRLAVSYEDVFRRSDQSIDNHEPLKDTVGNHAAVSSAAVSITRSANSAPEFPSSETGTRSVDENTPAGRNIGSPIAATDADNDRRTYSISGTDAASFDVVPSSGQLRTKGALDHESRRSYSFTMSVTDSKDIHGFADEIVDDTINVTVTVNDVNEPPTVTGDTEPSVDENTERFSRFYSAADPEGAASTYTWSLLGTDSGDFNIDSSTGELTFRITPDYESPADSNRDNEYLVTVQATDQDSLKGMLSVTVTVDGVNEPPTVTGIEHTTFAENAVRSVATYRATDPERDTIAWTVSGTDRDDFEISQTGVLTFTSIPDFENPADANQDNVYLVTVVATDQGSLPGTLDVTVTVTNAAGAEEPTITTTSDPSPYRENGTGTVHTFRARDPQGRPVSWTLTGTDGHAFEIGSNGALTFRSPPDFEIPTDFNGDNKYEISVMVTDDQGLTDRVDVTVTVTNDAEGVEPTITTRRPPSTYRENGTSVVYAFRATDPQQQTMTWSLEGDDAGDFDLSTGGALTFRTAPDFENPVDSDRLNDYELAVIATDEDGHRDRLTFAVTVTDVDEGPEISRIGSAPGSVLENHDPSLVLARYTATDPENPTAQITRWSTSGTDGGDFVIDEQGELRFKITPDYERPADSNRDNVYVFTVRAYDGRVYGIFEETVTVTQIDERPTITTTSRSATELRQAENRTTRLYTYKATDPERATISWSVGGADGRFFTIDERGQFSFSEDNSPNFEQPRDSGGDNVYNVTIQAMDDGFNTGTLDVVVTVTDVNEGPEIGRVGSAPGSVLENHDPSLVLARYTATDPENPTDQITRWSTSGTDGGDFVIDEQGELRFKITPDYERPADSNRDNVYVFTVRAYDGRVYGIFEETVTVTQIDERPTITTTSRSATELRQAENRTTRLYTYKATDPERATISWSVGGADGRFFTIDERGQFSFSEDNSPNFEQPRDSGGDNVYNVTIQAMDDGFNTGTLDVVVTVTDVNEGPEVTGGGDSFDVQENRNWSGASFTAEDPEGGSITRWALGGRDGGDFVISETGVMTFRSVPDHERPADSNRDNEYEVEVRPYDGRYYGSHHVVVTVEDVNEITGAATLNRAENFEGTLGTYSAVGRGDLTVEPKWSLSGTDSGDFTIDENGQLTFRNIPDYESPRDSNRDNTYLFTVRATDDRYFGTLDVTAVVAPVNEHGPVIRSGSRNSFTYREEGTSVIYTFSAADGDRDDIISWTTGGADGHLFEFKDGNALVFKEPPDHEAPRDTGQDQVYNLTVVATDKGGRSDSLDVAVTVTEVNEGPEVSGPASFTLRENQGLANAVYTATDPEGANVARWNVAGRDGGDFFITQGGTLYFRTPPDYERPADSNRDNVYEVSVQASDGRNTGSYPVTVTVTGVNERPEFRRGSSTSFTQAENRTTRLYTYSATDPEGSTVTWSVAGPDRSHFTIDERGQFSFREDSAPNFDAPGDVGGDNVYNVTIQARDDQFNTAGLPVTVTVTEVNEGPVIARQGNAPGSVPENQDQSRVLARYTGSDPERPSVQITRWSTVGPDGGDFVINPLGELRFKNTPDYERPADANRDNVYEVAIRASDGRNTNTLEEVQTVTVTDVDEAPTITTTSRTSFSQQENRISVLYTFRATDPERSDIAWSAVGDDGSHFTINEGGQFAFTNPPDFDSPGDRDGNNVYRVTIEARDDRGGTGRLEITVTVTDHNEGVEPTISTRRPPSNYRENGTSIIYTFRASDPQRGTISWSVTGADSGSFAISESGSLTFNSPPDFESPTDRNRDNEYEVAVLATDDEGHSDRVDFTITVLDDNEGVEPTISTRRPPSAYRENDTRTVYTFRASDPQRSEIRWSLTGTDAGDFTITTDSSGRGVLTFNDPPDFENPVDSNQDNEYELAVVATDEDNHVDRVDFTITVTDVNEPPVLRLEGAATTSVPENHPDTGVLANYTSTDPDDPTANIFRWSTAGRDGGDFVINELGELRFRSSPDYERPADSNRDNVYEVFVRASDGRSYGTLEEPLIVTVSQVNEAPVITTKNKTEFTLRENFTAVLYTYRAKDEDADDAITWSVEGTDGGDFAIYNGALTFRLLPDLEIPADDNDDNVYEITVVAADQAGLRDTVDAVITITDQTEGSVIAGRTSFTFAENYDITQQLETYTATDAKDNRTVYPTWSLSGRDGGDFVIDRVSGVLAFRNTPDYDRPADSNRDNIYEVTIRAHDSRAYGYLDVKVTVTNVNEEAPVVTGRTSHSVKENTASAIYTYRATDPDRGDTFTWTTGGNDGHLFEMSDRGALSFRSEPDFETPLDTGSDNVYELEVVATDEGGLRGILEVTVTVTEVNEGPVVSGGAAFTIDENQDLPNAVYTARDPEAIGGVTTTITWSTSGRDGGDFTIDRETGVLTFRTPPDYERPADSNRDNVYEVTVRAHDGRNYGYFDVTVTVLAVNEGPETTGKDTFSYRENGTSALYTYRATDPEGDEFTWDLGGFDAGDFTITTDSSGRGVLTFASPPDFDSPAGSGTDGNEYLVTVQARDDQGNTGELAVTVTVTDQNEGAVVSGQETISVRENRDPTLTLATYSATDPEGEVITRWSLSGSDGGDFTINEHGELTFRNTPDYDRPADSNRDNEYLVTVRAYDGRTYGNLDVTITVSNENEHAPVISSSSRTSFTYREEGTSALYTYRATDQDKDDVITWSTGGTDGYLFEFNDRNGLVFTDPPDYENPRDSGGDNEYELTVVATDTGGLADSLDVTVTVTEVNEGPEVSGTVTFTITENRDLTGATFSAWDPEEPDAEVTSWRLAGSDAGDFTITDTGQNTAELTFRNTPDYDRPADSNRDSEYLVTIRAYNGSTYGSLDVTVTVTDENEAEPVVTGRETLSFRENTPTTTRLYTYRATDADRDTTIAWNVRGTDGDDFTISDKGELYFSSKPDHEQAADSNSDNVYEITVVASDGFYEGNLDVSVTVTAVNEGPEITGQDSRTVSENYVGVLATYFATDPEDTSLVITRWGVTGRDGGDFTINEAGELTFRNPPEFERPADSNRDNTYEVTVRASDGRVYGTYDVTVLVEDVNEAPEFRSGSKTSFTYRENGTSAFYTFWATDPEQGEIAWSLRGNDVGDFVISETGVLTFASPPDFDIPSGSGTHSNEYLVTVVVTDDGTYGSEGQLIGASLEGTLELTVTVTDLNEGPEIHETSTNTAITVRENHDQVLATYSATDPEDPDAEITRWSVTGRDGGDFTINEAGELTFRNPPDFERPADSNRDNIYEVTVRASDGRYYGTLDVTVTVEAVDEAPEFRKGSKDAFVYKENGTSAIYTYQATDPEGADVSWGWSGTDRSAFTVSESGVLSFVSPPDYESPTDSGSDNVYELIVEASDEHKTTTRLEVTVTVTNLTDARVSIRGTAQVGRTLLAEISGTDKEGGKTKSAFSYQWSADDGDIDGATDPTYKITEEDQGKKIEVKVKLTDDQGNEKTLTSPATEVVSAKSNNAATGTLAIAGAAKVGETLTAVTSGITDADGLDNVSYSYQWVRNDGTDDEDIAGATGSTYTLVNLDEGNTIKVKVSFTDDEGNAETLTSPVTTSIAAAPALLIVSLTSRPASHNGTDTFTFEVSFSEEPKSDFSYETLRDHAFTVTGGSVKAAGRTNRPSNISWRITIQPDGDGDVTIVLPVTTDCEAAGAVCTDDGRKLSTDLSMTVPGPVLNSPATGVPTISGTAEVGQTLTADTTGIADADGLAGVSFAYQWLADDADIAGATAGTYLLTTSEMGKTIKVKVSFTDDDGNAESLTSAATAEVSPAVQPQISSTAATGAPTISGTARVDQTLTAETSGISDADGLDNVTFSYQWIRSDGTDDSDIEDATSSTYTLVDDDEGKTIKVKVSFTDDAGNAEELTSAATAKATAKPNSAATGAPTISGTVEVGQTLTTDTSGISDEDGLGNVSYSYQWIRNDGADDSGISDATGSTYTLVDDDEGKTIKVKVSFTDDAGNAEELTSAATAKVTAKPNSAATGAPTISGTVQVGQTLTADTSGISDEDGLGNVSYSYQWIRNDGADDSGISDATGSTYTLVDDDEGKTIKVKVSFTDDEGNDETLTSAATVSVAAAPALLTVSLTSGPAGHNGTGTFTFEMSFSEEVKLSYKTLRDHAFTVTGGSVKGAGRMNRPSNISWRITIQPDGDGDVTIVLPVTTDCEAAGAVCTGDGRKLSSGLSVIVPGPVQNSPATGAPTISGTAQVGQTLTADTSGIVDDDGLDDVSYSYQWIRNDGSTDADIPGKTGPTYVLSNDDVGKTIKVRVSFTDDANNNESLTSAATAAAMARPNSPATGAPPSAARRVWARPLRLTRPASPTRTG